MKNYLSQPYVDTNDQNNWNQGEYLHGGIPYNGTKIRLTKNVTPGQTVIFSELLGSTGKRGFFGVLEPVHTMSENFILDRNGTKIQNVVIQKFVSPTCNHFPYQDDNDPQNSIKYWMTRSEESERWLNKSRFNEGGFGKDYTDLMNEFPELLDRIMCKLYGIGYETSSK